MGITDFPFIDRPMSPEDLPLRDIHLPEPIGFFPLAPGWWGLIGAGLLLLLAVLLLLWQRRRVTALKLALEALDQWLSDPSRSLTEQSQRLSILLKQLALTTHERGRVASLSGPLWLEWLEQRPGHPPLSPALRALLEEGPYRPPTAPTAEALSALKSELQGLIRALAKPPKEGRFSVKKPWGRLPRSNAGAP